MTPIVVGKLENAFSLGCSDREACLIAGIHKDTLYEYCKKNPDFSDRKQQLKLFPIIRAKQTVYKALERDPKLALRYLEKTLPYEFGKYSHVDIEQKDEGLSPDELNELKRVLNLEGIPFEDN